jgi:integrase
MWVGSVTLPDGKRKAVYGKTQAKAREKLDKVKADVEAGRPITIGKGLTVERYLADWTTTTLPQRVAAGRMAQSTLTSYSDNVRLHINPHLGHVELAKLSPSHLRKWLLELQQKPAGRQRKPTEDDPEPEVVLLSPRMVAYCHAILRKALSDAMGDELVTRNVAMVVEPPAGKSNRGRPLTREQARDLLAAAAGDQWSDVWLVTLGLALRRGEALALRWSNLDLENGEAHVGPSLQRVRALKADENGRRKGTLQVVKGKTEDSTATIPIPPVVLKVLRERKERQAAEIEQAPAWVDPDLVFTTRAGTPIEPRNVNRAWSALCRRVGVEGARVHSLRHSAATWLYEEGVEMKDIQHALRHSRLATTSEIYAHLTKRTQARAAAAMDGALSSLGGVDEAEQG